MEKVIVLGFALFLSACAHTPPAVTCTPITVRVPVPVAPPVPPVIPKPVLPIETLPPAVIQDPAQSATVLRALVASLQALLGYSDQLKAQLDAYRSHPKPQP